MTVDVSIVLPLYRTRSAVAPLAERLRRALPAELSLELVFVDDCCPERSCDAALAVAEPNASITVVRHAENHGQHAAVVTGLSIAAGAVIVAMDADLQDAPEDVPFLLEALARSRGQLDAVAAGRRGDYENRGRRATGRVFRRALHMVSRGRIPPHAGMFLVMTERARDGVVALRDPRIHLLAALARIGARVAAVPVVRYERPAGSTSYDAPARLRVAVRALASASALHPIVQRLDAATHTAIVAERLERTQEVR